MLNYSDESLQGMTKLFDICDHILEEDVPDWVVAEMREWIICLEKQSDAYRKNLLDQERNSKSELSRKMASLLLTEDRKIEAVIESEIPIMRDLSPDDGRYACGTANKRDRSDGMHDREKQGDMTRSDVNIGALYVEYLTGRAMQSIRDALIGAMKLKILSKNTEMTK